MNRLDEVLTRDQHRMHTVGDETWYRADLGGRTCVVVMVKKLKNPTEDDRSGSVIVHPNILLFMGYDAEHNRVYECYDTNLFELESNVALVLGNLPSSVLIEILIQILEGLTALRHRIEAHGNLILENIGIQLIPHNPPAEALPQNQQPNRYGHEHGHGVNFRYNLDPLYKREHAVSRKKPSQSPHQLIVKLKGNARRLANRDNLVTDLRCYANILERYLKRDGSFKCVEAEDLIHKIRNDYRGLEIAYLTEDQWVELSDRFEDCYVVSPHLILDHPLFWSSEKCLRFLAILDNFICMLYTDPKRAEGDQFKNPIRDFIRDLKKLNVRNRDGSDWFSYLHPTIQQNACRQWFFAKDLDSPISVIKSSRNTFTHYDTYSDVEKKEIGQPDCYGYFYYRFPHLVMHAYNCLQLHYAKLKHTLRAKKDISFDDYFSPYLSMFYNP